MLITSPDGTRIATKAAGPTDAPSLLFIHGWAQHLSCWAPVMDRLADRFRVVAMDLRGHGGSDKPDASEAYTNTALWAGDVASVIEGYGLRQPTLVGWSYGARVMAAYLAHHGSKNLSGLVTVGGILAIGKSRPDWMVGAATPALDRDLYTEDLSRLLPATVRFVEACTTAPLPRALFAEIVGANMLCPAHVRRALFAADQDFQDVFAALDCPGLVIHGTADIVVPAAVGEAAARLMPQGRYVAYEGLGHAPFLEDATRFAADMAEFVTDARADA